MKRRDIIKSAPVVWATPTISSVILPAHAVTSDVQMDPPVTDPPRQVQPTTTPAASTTPEATTTPGTGCNQCPDPTLIRIKYEASGSWTTGVGTNDCVQSGFDREDIGSNYGRAIVAGRGGTFILQSPGCWIVSGGAKAGRRCHHGDVRGDCQQEIVFRTGGKDISNLTIIIACC